jgi:hypothetical protein
MLYPGAIVWPDDLNKLSRVCATICGENGFEPRSGIANALATQIFRLFMNGLTEERELLGVMRNRCAHQSAKYRGHASQRRAESGLRPNIP